MGRCPSKWLHQPFQVSSPPLSCSVSCAAKSRSETAEDHKADQHDEIDVEILGGDPSHWQSNIFTTSPKDQQPLWGVFGEIEDFPKKTKIDQTHTYTIDWNEDRIIWSVDGSTTRTIHKCQSQSLSFYVEKLSCHPAETKINGTYHYPSHAARIQLGIWDASNPAGTSEWANGPINWKTAPSKMAATFTSITVECPG